MYRDHRRTQWPKGAWVKVIDGERLRKLILQKGLSYTELAEDVRTPGVRCSKSMIGHLVTGERPSCTPQLAERIARRLEVPLDVLFVPSVSLDKGQTVKRQARKAA